MLTAESYQFAWMAYATAVTGMLLAGYLLLRDWVSRTVLLGLFWPLAVLLLTPVSAEEGADFLAPALIVGVFEWLSIGTEAVARSARPIAVVVGLAIALELIVLTGWMLLKRRRGPEVNTT